MTKTKFFLLIGGLALATGAIIAYRELRKSIEEMARDLFDDKTPWGVG